MRKWNVFARTGSGEGSYDEKRKPMKPTFQSDYVKSADAQQSRVELDKVDEDTFAPGLPGERSGLDMKVRDYSYFCGPIQDANRRAMPTPIKQTDEGVE
jgi:hypothetical protein